MSFTVAVAGIIMPLLSHSKVMKIKVIFKLYIYSVCLLVGLFYGLSGSVFAAYSYEAYAPTVEDKLVYSGGIAGEQLGASIAHGDFNGDNIEDLLVSSPFASTGAKEWNGQLSVFYGKRNFVARNIDLSQSMADFNIYGEHSGDQLGTSMAVADFNGDGIDDIAVGAYNAYFNDSRPGKVYVMYGQAGDSRQSVDLELDKADIDFVGYMDGDNFGLSLSTVDVNGDFISDLLVGAPNAAAGELKSSGAVYGYYGPLKKSLPDLTYYGQEEGENFGSIIAGGNLTANVLNDVAIGAYKADKEGMADVGKVYIYKSLPEEFDKRVAPTSTVEGVSTNSWFGFALDVADINNDGVDDIAIGAFPYASEASNGGVYVYYGGKKFGEKHFRMTADQADTHVEGDLVESILGAYVVLDDLNNDEKMEIVMGAPAIGYPVSSEPGRVFALYSFESSYEAKYDVSVKNVDSTIHGYEADDWFGYSLDVLDFNDDGAKDLVVGARYADAEGAVNNGKVFVFFGDRKPFGIGRVVEVVEIEEEEEIEGLYASRGEMIGMVIDSFELESKKESYLQSCYDYREFCLFNFLAMSSYDDIELEPEIILYPDVQPGSEYYDDVVTGTMLGLVNGYMDDEDSPFRPEAPVSRIQALKVVLGASEQVPLKYKFELVSSLGSIEDLLNQYSYFADVNPAISYMWWYPRYINFAVENGIIDEGEYFRPDDNITIDELNDLIMRTNAFINSADEEIES